MSDIDLVVKLDPKPAPRRLVYDVETYATGFADPAWVPQVVTCIAWKWLDEQGGPESEVFVSTSTDYRQRACPMPHLDPRAIREMLIDFVPYYAEADEVITYNGARFDQPVLNSMLWYIGAPPLLPTTVIDLHAFGKVKGMKKGLDNVAAHLGLAEQKQAMNHAEWQAAYLEEGWPTIKSRAVSDVLLTEAVYHAVKNNSWLRPARRWKP
jgi:DNA polymerase elongation subunit (family B)